MTKAEIYLPVIQDQLEPCKVCHGPAREKESGIPSHVNDQEEELGPDLIHWMEAPVSEDSIAPTEEQFCPVEGET